MFDSTLRFLERHKVPVGYFYVLEPKKGTPFFDRMLEEDRIVFDPSKPSHANKCTIKPKNYTPEQLESSVRGMYERFYSLRSMIRRLPPPTSQANIASWIINLSQRRNGRAERNVENFDWV